MGAHEEPAAGVAASAAGADGVTIRQLAGPDEYRACFDLQLTTWGSDFRETVPPSVLKISQYVGGVAAGAFAADGRLLGFVYGLTGVRPPGGGRRLPPVAAPPGTPLNSPERPPGPAPLVHWSHMLAVAPEARDLRLGMRLKLYQRDLLAPLGIEAMEWTFDPLEARNAHLNLNLLGAEVIEYVEEMYAGEMGSQLAHGIGTDRFIVRWQLAAPAGAGGAGAAPDPLPDGAARQAATAARFAEAPCAPLILDGAPALAAACLASSDTAPIVGAQAALFASGPTADVAAQAVPSTADRAASVTTQVAPSASGTAASVTAQAAPSAVATALVPAGLDRAALQPGQPPLPPTPLPSSPRVRVEVPSRIQDLKAESPERALAWRLASRRAFTEYLARGYRVAGFYRAADGRCFYALESGNR
jgi:predicted GNAT superfamily acetyltransferase